MQQTRNAENCMKLTQKFAGRMNTMNAKSLELIGLADNMSEVNKQGNASIVNLSASKEKNKRQGLPSGSR